MENTAGGDTLARGAHVNVEGPGLKKPAHMEIVPTSDGKGLTTNPDGDANFKKLNSNQLSNACACVVEFFEDPKNLDKIAKQAKSGIDTHQNQPRRTIILQQVYDLIKNGAKVK